MRDPSGTAASSGFPPAVPPSALFSLPLRLAPRDDRRAGVVILAGSLVQIPFRVHPALFVPNTPLLRSGKESHAVEPEPADFLHVGDDRVTKAALTEHVE